MIQTVFVQMTTKMTPEDRFFMQAKGTLPAFQDKAVHERLENERELNTALEDGWVVLASTNIDDSHGMSIAFLLYRSDFSNGSKRE